MCLTDNDASLTLPGSRQLYAGDVVTSAEVVTVQTHTVQPKSRLDQSSLPEGSLGQALL